MTLEELFQEEPKKKWAHNPNKNDLENFSELISYYFGSTKKEAVEAINENVRKSHECS